MRSSENQFSQNSISETLPLSNNMQITVQMLDGSITPFKVRTSITIASLKAKFEPWQPMKGRALLHHDVQLDDRAILGAIPGVKNGTILRVDKRVTPVKSKANGKKSVKSGPPDAGVDEDVMESIETSGGEERTSSGSERRRTFGSEQRRPSTPVLDEMCDDPLGLPNTNTSNKAMALRIIKQEKRTTTSPLEPTTSPHFQAQSHRLYSSTPFFTPPLENPSTSPNAGIHITNTNDGAASSRLSLMDDIDATFLTNINAAERSPLNSEGSAESDVSAARRCNACGRACACGDHRLDISSNEMAPAAAERSRGSRAITRTTQIDSNGVLLIPRTTTTSISRQIPIKQCTESNWTGM